MNNQRSIVYISLGTLFFGMLLYAYFQEWIIIRSPHLAPLPERQENAQTITKKKAQLIFWHKGKWKTETEELLWSDNVAVTLEYLINSWLTLLDQENIMDHKVTLQTAILNGSGSQVYLSFDRDPLPNECSTFETWMWIEGLLKTIRANKIKIQSVQFLVHHQPLINEHLDFSNPWPISGFLED